MFVNNLIERAKKVKSIVCMGIDPVLDDIPLPGEPRNVIEKFFLDILKEMQKQKIFPAVIKPNIAFFEQYGPEGLEALKMIIGQYKMAGIPVILDAKRGDIGKTSYAYASTIFNNYNADSTTVAPYMGTDSVSPFIDYCKEGKGVYVLCRTSNKGAKDFQDLDCGGEKLYLKVARKVLDWYSDGVGVVVGATYPGELEELSKLFVDSGKKVPMLIPGVGAQGGSAKDVAGALAKTGNDLYLHRINSSSGISYAYKKQDTEFYAKAAVKAIKDLNDEIGL